MSQALAAHDALARSAVECRRGTVVKLTGDGIHAVFDDALAALAATLDMQQALADPAATCGVALRVRCGLHAGVVERRDNDYFGSPVNRAARIMRRTFIGAVAANVVAVPLLRPSRSRVRRFTALATCSSAIPRFPRVPSGIRRRYANSVG